MRANFTIKLLNFFFSIHQQSSIINNQGNKQLKKLQIVRYQSVGKLAEHDPKTNEDLEEALEASASNQKQEETISRQ